MKKTAILAVTCLLIPQIVFAAWWNPFSWKVFSWLPIAKKEQVVEKKNNQKNTQEVAVVTTTSSVTASEILKLETLKKEIESAKNLAETERLKAEKAKAEASAAKAESEKQNLQNELNTLKTRNATQVNNVTSNQTDTSNKGTLCNGTYWSACPIGRTFVCPSTGKAYCSYPQTGKNYYDDVKYRARTLISLNKSFESWLQDTSNQFRSASLTLAGYNTGGLYGELRDTSIKIANAEVAIISSLLENTRKNITYYENVLDVLNNSPQGFLDESILNKLATPEGVEADMVSVKKSINADLVNVLEDLKYH